MRPLITLIVSSLLMASCACDKCDAQLLPRRGYSTFDPNQKLTGASHHEYNAGRMPELPSGPNKLHVWVVLSDNWERDPVQHSIATAVRNDPRIAQIKAGCYWNYYVVSSPKFRDSGLVGATGTATPIMVVTDGKGMIRHDGTGGLFVNAQSCPQSGSEAVDLLCDAIGQFNPVPVVDGQTTATPIVRESSSVGSNSSTFGNCVRCGRQIAGGGPCPDCTPPAYVQPSPNGGGTLTTVRPRPKYEKYLQYAGYGMLGVAGLMFVSIVGMGGVVAIGSVFQRAKSRS